MIPACPFGAGTQNGRVYRACERGVSNIQLMNMRIPKYTGRISDCREYLRKHGLKIVGKRIGKSSLWIYKITE
jgi:hypothetical protein